MTQDITQKFFRKGYPSNVNLMHNSNKSAEGVYMFESLLIDSARGILPPKGFDGLSEGSWFGSFKVDNPAIWQDVLAGTFQGFSVEGMFEYQIEEEITEKEINDIVREIEKL